MTPDKKFVEKTLLVTHPAMIRSHPIAFVFCLVLILAFGFGLVVLLLWWLHCLSYTLTITSRKTIVRTGLIAKNTTEVQHDHIRNIQVKQGVFDRLFRVGTIGISSSAQSDIELVFKGLKSPDKVKDVLASHRPKDSRDYSPGILQQCKNQNLN